MRKTFIAILASLTGMALLTSCALVEVKVGHSLAVEAKRTLGALATSNQAAAKIQRAGDKKLPDSQRVELLLEAIRETSNGSRGTEDRKLNQLGTSLLVEILAENHFENSPVTITPGSRETLDPRQATKLIPSPTIQIKGLRERITVEGAGVPYVAWFAKGSLALSGQPSAEQTGMSIPATALVRFNRKGAELTFYRRLQRESVVLNDRKETLAADFSAPIAYLLSQGKNSAIDIQALVFSDSNFKHTGLLQIDEYDPKKIPAVFVHGLLCRPEAWTPAVNQLLADPEIRSRYQFWFFLYPTGLPVWWSAAKLRSELDRFRSTVDPSQKNPNLDEIVLVGHSMGGLISSLVVRKGGDNLWRQFTDTPPEKLKISTAAKEHLAEIINFEPRTDIERVIFVATPHQGSQLALNPVAEFFSKLVRLPTITTSNERFVMVNAIRSNMRDLFVAPANSIRFLQAKSPLLLSILKLPMSKRVTYHSVIGDQGKGDTPQSSDGVVPYWSSHLPNAKSEKVVPSGHGANEDPEGIEEIRRILRLHLLESSNP
ncbi:MAG: lipase family alpha/beta hydrolase [Spartobacteria bacterium]